MGGRRRRVWTLRVALALVALCELLAPVLVLLAIYQPSHFAFGTNLVLVFLFDVFERLVACRLNVATPTLRGLDSFADSVFYLAALFAAWYLRAQALQEHYAALLVLAGLELARYVFDPVKFRCAASYHMWSSKLWGIALFVGCFAWLALGISGVAVALAIYIGIVADIEGLAIAVILQQWKNDVPTFVHALQLRAAILNRQ